MSCQNSGINMYPDIILSDSTIQKIVVNNADIDLIFNKKGFVKKAEDGRYYRTEDAKVTIRGCDVENISMKEVRTHKASEDFYFESAYYLDKNIFLEKINASAWRFEVVHEFYAVGARRGFFMGQIHADNENFWCHIMIDYKDLLYQWGDIRKDRPFN